MIAARSSSEITPLANSSKGDTASSIWSIASYASAASSMVARASAPRTLSPSGTTTTTCAVVPPACGKVRPRESSATWDSVPGRSNDSSKSPPPTAATPPSTTSTVSQVSSRATRRRKAQRPKP